MSNRIFISYRREDSAAWAGRLHDQLAEHFGPDNIFMDVDDIDPGLNFVETIENAISQTKVLVVIIGPAWLDAADSEGNHRLEHPEDFVRIEISAGLKRNIRVIPVLIDNAAMPRSTDLPGELQSLTLRNGVKINHSSFRSDVQRLIHGLEGAIRQAEAESAAEEKPAVATTVSGKKRILQVVAPAAMVIAILTVAGWFIFTSPNHKQGDIMTDKVTGIQLVYIAKGCFQMGSSNGDINDAPAHEVCLDHYWVGKTEVTQGQWLQIMDSNPAHFLKGDNYPVETVSWDNVQEFLSRLNNRSGRQFRLPTEAEWEYACLARSNGPYCGGKNINDLAWYTENSYKTTHSVGKKQENDFDLFDMSGNVWEWCQDWYGADYYRNSPRNNPQGPSSGSYRVFRGGSWHNEARYTLSANRSYFAPSYRKDFLGFRLVLPPDQ